jgi:hypothetical protein
MIIQSMLQVIQNIIKLLNSNAVSRSGPIDFQKMILNDTVTPSLNLKKCLGIQASAVHSFDISTAEYRSHRRIIGIDTEKQLSSGWTGMNTKSGDLLKIKFNHLACPPAQRDTQMYVSLHSYFFGN